MSESLYFIAVIPPSDVQNRITGLKEEIAEKYGSRHALRSPPHITLHMPFKWKDKKSEQLMKLMEGFNEKLEPFAIELKDFDFFEPRVVFVDVVPNEPLNELQKLVVDGCRKQLKLNNANYKDRPFHPHVTIGFRDLKKPMFFEAKNEFGSRQFDAEFQVNKIALLKHDGTKWNIMNDE